MSSILSDLHWMLLNDGFEFWDGLYHKGGTTWRLVCRDGGWRLEVVWVVTA